MGALFLLIYNTSSFEYINANFTKCFMKLKAKGEDATVYTYESTPTLSKIPMDRVSQQLSRRQIAEYSQHTFVYGFHRMAINDLTLDGDQPFEDPIRHKMLEYPDLRVRPSRKLFGTGEIYNYKDLKEHENFTDKDLQSNSDIEIILPLFIKYGIYNTVNKLNGEYSFYITENVNTYILDNINVYVGRDQLGTRSLYVAQDEKQSFHLFASELKAIPESLWNDKNVKIMEFPIGSIWSFKTKTFTPFFNWESYLDIENTTYKDVSPNTLSIVYESIKEELVNSTRRRFDLAEKTVGVLLSGGFDSSLILSILAKYVDQNVALHAFTIGDANSNDVMHARHVVNSIREMTGANIFHHIVSVDYVDISNKILNVIEILETYDSTNIRAGVCYTYLFEYIKKNTDVKILLTGEGLDELCGYSKLFEMTDENFQRMSIKLLTNLSKFDLMRCDKLGSAYGLELRNPYLDMNFINLMLSIHPKLKRPQTYNYKENPIEKYIVRKAFDVSICNEIYLPNDVLWRPLADVSDSLLNIKQAIFKYCDTCYSSEEVELFCISNNVKEVLSKEHYHYLKAFLAKYNKLYANLKEIGQWTDLWQSYV